MTGSRGMSNKTVMSDNDDGASDQSSYAWLIPTLTAFGLLLFLTLSFMFYHRRIATKKRNEEEHNNYFQIVRPDLVSCDKRILRARSILTNTHDVVGSFYSTNESGCYNEAFEGEYISDIERQMTYTDWIEKRNTQTADKHDSENNDVKFHGALVTQSQADVHTHKKCMASGDKPVVAESNVRQNKPMDHNLTYMKKANKRSISKEQYKIIDPTINIENLQHAHYTMHHLTSTVEIPHETRDKTKDDVKAFKASQCKTLDSEKDQISTDISHENNVDERPIGKITEHNEMLWNKKTNVSSLIKKKRRGLLSRITQRQNISLDEHKRDISVFYSEPRRQSEPELFLYSEEAADPNDAALFSNQNKVLFNPYYTEVSLPVNLNRKKRSHPNHDDNEIDLLKNSNESTRKLSLPVTEDISQKHVSFGTWM